LPRRSRQRRINLSQIKVTRYEFAVVRWVPFGLHLVIDFALASFLLISPWLLGFSYDPLNVWQPPVNLALVEIIITLLTLPDRRSAVSST